jgi:hypothetical protein
MIIVYYRYLNAHGKGTGATAFLFVVAILDAGRNALSFFMLLVVSMGLSVVKESLGPTMIRCQVLTGAHFIFGGEAALHPTFQPILTPFRSAVCGRCRRAGTRVNICARAAALRHPARIHAQRLLALDSLLSERSAMHSRPRIIVLISRRDNHAVANP